MKNLSITERPNELSFDIDISNEFEFLRILRQTDSQIFAGYLRFPGLKDDIFIKNLYKAYNILFSKITQSKKIKIIFTGAGTSGRLSMLTAELFKNEYEKILGYNPLDFLIAGSNLALIKAQEGAEDDPIMGMKELENKIQNLDYILIGITCGFSANYVGGQLYKAIIEDKQNAFLIGFNPLDFARKIKPENWDKSFFDVINIIKNKENFTPLNPVIGPEPITGSTRMKSGTTTKIITDSLLYLVLKSLKHNSSYKNYNNFKEAFLKLLNNYYCAYDNVYNNLEPLAKLIKDAGLTLRNNGNIYYIGESFAGKLGIIDASECPPTYGAGYHDVRGFMKNGWQDFCSSSHDLSNVDNLYNISFNNLKNIIAKKNNNNYVIFITGSKKYFTENKEIFSSLKNTKKILLTDTTIHNNNDYDLILKNCNDINDIPIFTSISIKLIFNAITTFSHVFKGKVYKNRMIDLRISNNKLYYRSINIVKDIADTDEQTAESSILKAIYDTDTLSDTILKSPISKHILIATDKEKVIPIALLLATGKFDLKKAKQTLKETPIIRNIINIIN